MDEVIKRVEVVGREAVAMFRSNEAAAHDRAKRSPFPTYVLAAQETARRNADMASKLEAALDRIKDQSHGCSCSEHLSDLVHYGKHICRNGKRIAPEDFYAKPKDDERN